MKLYTSPTSPYGRLVLLAALPRHDLDFAIAYTNPWENPAELQALNPFSQVPVLQTDSGTVIGNSPFILDFLLGHPLRTAEQTATAAFAFSLLDQLVKLFGLQKFKAENTPRPPAHRTRPCRLQPRPGRRPAAGCRQQRCRPPCAGHGLGVYAIPPA